MVAMLTLFMTSYSTDNIITLLSQALMALQLHVLEIISFIFSERVHNSG